MTPLQRLLLPLLIPLSWVYGIIILLRNYLYNIGLFRSVAFNTPIISVGNITTGGTGKTPMVIYLAKLLERSGYKPGIVSRGYGRNSRGVIIVHDDDNLLTNVDRAGDEPYLMGKELYATPIIVSENRIAGIQKLLDNSSVDIIILDDAFQHRKVERIIDFVMISIYDKSSDYHLLPWGNLREPLSSLRRAQHVIYTKTKQFQKPHQYNILNPYLKNPPIISIMQPLLMKVDGTGYHKTLHVNEPVFAFCGIGDPNSFIQTVKEVGLNIISKRFFKDHENYYPRVLQDLSLQIQSNNCRAVVTTEKDMVKIPESFMQEFIFYVIKIDIVFENDSDVMDLIKPFFHSFPA